MVLRLCFPFAALLVLTAAPRSAAQDRPPPPPVAAPAPPEIPPPTLDFSTGQSAEGTPADSLARTNGQSPPTPDVVIEVERLRLDSLRVAADYVVLNLRLNADVADLLHIDAGLEVRLDSLTVEAHGAEVATQARLYLDVVTELLSEALQVIDDHPELAGAAPAPKGAGADGDGD